MSKGIPDCFCQPSQIADGIEPSDGLIARTVIGLAGHGGDVVNPNRTVESHVTVAFERFDHVGLPIVVECFVETLQGTGYVTEMHEKDSC